MDKTSAPSLAKTLVKRHVFTIANLCGLFNLEVLFRCVTPYFVARVTSYFDPSVNMELNTALFWTIGLAVLSFLRPNLRTYVFYRTHRFGSVLRVGVSGLIYRKACRITQREMSKRSIGLIVNLITNDVQRLEESIDSMSVFSTIWLATGISLVIMYYEIGLYTALAGFATLLLFLPIQIGLSKLAVLVREKASTLTDSRVKCIHEMVLFIKVIKMCGWETMWSNIIKNIRRKEAKYIGGFVLIDGILAVFYDLSLVLALFVFVTLKWHINEQMTSSQIFFFLSMIGSLRIYVPLFLGKAFMYVSQLTISLKRIENFLSADEVQHLNRKSAILNLTEEVILNRAFLNDHQESLQLNGNGVEKINTTISEMKLDNTLVLEGFSSSWGVDSFSLVDINLKVNTGELIAVVGPVACGKTTLLMSILRELDYFGQISISERIGFSSQVPWIYNGSIMENILFNRPYDESKLNVY